MEINIFSMLFIMIVFGFGIACICSMLNVCIGHFFESHNRITTTKIQPIEEKKISNYIVVINPGDNPVSLGII